MRILVLFLALAGWCGAANWYVDPDTGNDGTNAVEDPELPAKTIDGCFADISTGDNIYLLAGDYTDTGLGAGHFLSFDRSINATIMPDPATNPTITWTLGAATGMIKTLANRTGYKLTIKDITLNMASGYVFNYGADCGGDFVFDGCTFTGTGQIASANTSLSTYAFRRNLTMIDCTASIVYTTTYPMYVFYFESMLIRGCAFTNNTTGSSYPFIFADFMRGPMHIVDSTFTSEFGIRLWSFQTDNASVIVDGCTFTNTDTASGAAGKIGVGILLGNNSNGTADTVTGGRIINNTFIGCYNAIQTYAKNSTFYNNKVTGGINGFVVWGGYKNDIRNNYIEADDGTLTGRCIVMGRKLYSFMDTDDDAVRDAGESNWAGPDDTTFDATTIVEGSATDWDLQYVATDRSMVVIVSEGNTDSAVPVAYGVITSADDATDTITVQQWIADPFGTPAVDADGPDDNTYYVSVGRWPDHSSVLNNILVKGGATNNFTFDFNPQAGRNYIDRNIYSGIASNIGNEAQTTLAALQAKWQSWPSSSEPTCYNDQNSVASSAPASGTVIFGGVVYGLESTEGSGSSGGIYKGGLYGN